MLMRKIDNKVTFYIIVLSAIVILRDIAGVGINKYFIIAFCAIWYIISSHDELIGELFFTFPLLCGLPGNYIMPIAFITMLVKKHYVSKNVMALLSYFLVIEIFSSMVLGGTFDISNELGYLVNLFIFFMLIYNDGDFRIDTCLSLYVSGIVFVSLIIISSTLIKAPSNWMSLMASGYFRFGTVEVSNDNSLRMTLNANALSYYSIAGLSCAALLLSRKNRNGFVQLIKIAILIIAGILTLSRTWFLCFALLLILFVLANLRGLRSGFKTILLVGSLILIFAIIANSFTDLTTGILARFSRSDISNGNGRIDLLLVFWNSFWNNAKYVPFGTGVVGYNSALGIDASIHNSVLQLLVCYGVIGFTVFIIGWMRPILCRLKNKELVYWIPFICIFIYSLGAQIVNPPSLLYPHLVAVLALQMGDKEIVSE